MSAPRCWRRLLGLEQHGVERNWCSCSGHGWCLVPLPGSKRKHPLSRRWIPVLAQHFMTVRLRFLRMKTSFLTFWAQFAEFIKFFKIILLSLVQFCLYSQQVLILSYYLLFQSKVKQFLEFAEIWLSYHWWEMVTWQQISLLLVQRWQPMPRLSTGRKAYGPSCTPQIWWTETEHKPKRCIKRGWNQGNSSTISMALTHRPFGQILELM